MQYAEEISKLKEKLKVLKWKYPFEFILDSREPAAIKTAFSDFSYATIKTMDVGDFHFRFKDLPESVYIIERKSLADLSGGIGKRAKNQKFRLLQLNIPTSQIMYLIEDGYVHPKYYKGISRIMGSQVNTMLRDKMSIFHTKNQQETIYFLYKMILKMNEFTDLYHVKPTVALGPIPTSSTEVSGTPVPISIEPSLHTLSPSVGQSVTMNDYAKTLQTDLKQNNTPELCYRRQLSVYYGCSLNKAAAIQEEFPTMRKLCAFLDTTPRKEAITKLANLRPKSEKKPYGNRLGEVLATRVYNYLDGLP